MAGDREQPVYSTRKGAAGGRGKAKGKKSKNAAEQSVLPAAGPCKMRLEKKGRGGKTVTTLFNLPLTADEAKELKKNLATRFGCGATLKGGVIELQGDRCEQLAAYFKAQGWSLVRAGG